MRVMVACDDESLRVSYVDALARIEVETVGACSLSRVALDAKSARPEVLLVGGVAQAAEAREALERARRATDATVAGLLLLPVGATWLRVPLPRDVRPAVVLASDAADDATLRRALDRLASTSGIPTGTASSYGLTLDRRTREARANDQRAVLTPNEAALLSAMLAEPSRVIRYDALARAVYGQARTDPRTTDALQEEVRRLRSHLDRLGVGEQLQAVRNIGVRFVERRGRPRPPR